MNNIGSENFQCKIDERPSQPVVQPKELLPKSTRLIDLIFIDTSINANILGQLLLPSTRLESLACVLNTNHLLETNETFIDGPQLRKTLEDNASQTLRRLTIMSPGDEVAKYGEPLKTLIGCQVLEDLVIDIRALLNCTEDNTLTERSLVGVFPPSLKTLRIHFECGLPFHFIEPKPDFLPSQILLRDMMLYALRESDDVPRLKQLTVLTELNDLLSSQWIGDMKKVCGERAVKLTVLDSGWNMFDSEREELGPLAMDSRDALAIQHD